jgi:hypothetical protein
VGAAGKGFWFGAGAEVPVVRFRSHGFGGVFEKDRTVAEHTKRMDQNRTVLSFWRDVLVALGAPGRTNVLRASLARDEKRS